MSLRTVFFILSVFFSLFVQAQGDTTGILSRKRIDRDSLIARTGTVEELSFRPTQFRPIDTTLAGIHRFDPNFFQNLGNHGTAVLPLVFNPERPAGFYLGAQGWQPYMWRYKTIPFYFTGRPFTEFYYTQGGGGFQTLQVTHSQNIRPNLNFAIRHHTLRSEGFYDNQEARQNHTMANLRYRSPNGRYAILPAVIWNRMRQQFNGGFNNDTIYGKLSGPVRATIPTHLDFALQEIKTREFAIRQFYYLGKTEMISVSDTDSVALPVVRGSFSIQHQISYEKQTYAFKDSTRADLLFYPTDIRFGDSILVADSIGFQALHNEVAIGNVEDKAVGENYAAIPTLAYRAFIHHAYLWPRHYGLRIQYQNLSVGGQVQSNLGSGKRGARLSGEYFVLGYNVNDYLFDGNAFQKIGKDFMLTFIAKAQRATPSLTEQYINNKYYFWNYRFPPASHLQIRPGLHWTHAFGRDTVNGSVVARNLHQFGLTPFAQRVYNYIYWDNEAKPVRLKEALNIAGVEFYHRLNIGGFRIAHSIRYQQASNEVVRIPDIIAHAEYAYERRVHPNLVARIGADIWYRNGYTPYAYMPITSTFYLQDTFSVQPYPIVDVYISGKVRNFFVYVKMQHLNQGFPHREDYALTLIPYSPRVLRLGLRWMFFN